jgi:hypothetical protein
MRSLNECAHIVIFFVNQPAFSVFKSMSNPVFSPSDTVTPAVRPLFSVRAGRRLPLSEQVAGAGSLASLFVTGEWR